MIIRKESRARVPGLWWQMGLMTFLACAVLAVLPAVADAGPTRCEVLAHAKQWVDNRIYYSQGPYGGYCAGSMYCDPAAGGACYRPDCSGFVSAAWGLPAPGNTTYSLAGGPWSDGASHIISFDDLKPGDALNFAGNPNTGTGHIRLFGGWLNAQKTRMWGYETSTCGTPAYRWERSRSEFGGYVAIRLNTIRECEPDVPLLTQINSNGAISVTNWEGREHVEVWVRGTNGTLHNAWSIDSDAWSELTPLASGAACGFASGFWPRDPGYAEVFMPTSAGGAQHTWFQDGDGWQVPADFEGQGLSEFSTLLWPDRRLEVFALGADGAIYNRFWRATENTWSEWYNFGGDFVTGATVITWGDGRPEIFATAADGKVWNRWWKPDENQWGEWSSILGGNLASRPIPIRWDDGRLEVFGRGKDGFLYNAWFVNGQWHPFNRMNDTPIKGEPSAVFNPRGNGGPFGPQVFARDKDDRLIELHMDGNGQWLEWRTLLHDRVLSSDPFGWIRGDGVGLLFAVDENGQLIHSHRDKANGWQPWETITGTTVDACIPAAAPDNSDPSAPAPNTPDPGNLDPDDPDPDNPPTDEGDPTTDPGQPDSNEGEPTTDPGGQTDPSGDNPPNGNNAPGGDGSNGDDPAEGDPHSDEPGTNQNGDPSPGGGSVTMSGGCAVSSGATPAADFAFLGFVLAGIVGVTRRKKSA